ncbi:MAG: tetratricopeptide repeat protein [Pseudomonadota bacterium]
MIWIILPIVLQVVCIIHLFRGSANRLWLLAIIALPLIGCLAYFLLEILPELSGNKHVRKARKQAVRAINPEGAIRAARERLELTDSSANRLALADALAEAGRPEEAAPAYRHALEAMPFADSATLFKLADALLLSNSPEAAQQVLDDMEDVQSDSDRVKKYLLKGRVAEALDDSAAARTAYAEALAIRESDEARCRLAAMHIAADQAHLALPLLRDVKQNYDLRDKALIDNEQAMYDWALAELARLEKS